MFVLRVVATAFLLLGSTTSAFKITKTSSSIAPLKKTTTTTQLDVSSGAKFDEFDANYMMARARACAYGEDTCNVDEASNYLRNIVQAQGACDAGTLKGADVCENQDVVAEVVALLRAKISGNGSIVATSAPTYREVPLAVTMIAFMITIALGGMIISRLTDWDVASADEQVVPFTWQEWQWALQGGYLDTMVHHYMKHGGL